MTNPKIAEAEAAYRQALHALDEATTALANRLDRRPSDDAEGDSTPEEMDAYLAQGDRARAARIAEQAMVVRGWIGGLPRPFARLGKR